MLSDSAKKKVIIAYELSQKMKEYGLPKPREWRKKLAPHEAIPARNVGLSVNINKAPVEVIAKVTINLL